MPSLVKLRIASVERAAKKRLDGYLEDVLGSAAQSDSVFVWIPSEEYSRIANDYQLGGPGTELKRLLAGFPFYIQATPACQCSKRARYMDKMGCDWCEQNVDQIVGWLKEEHERRKLLNPFSAFAAKQVVKLAIRRAKRGNSQ